LYFALSAAAFGQAHLVITAEGHHGATPPAVQKDDVQAQVDKHPAAVRDWIPLRGDQANLELFVVIDDGEDSDLGLQFGDLRNFMREQPATTKIGPAYLQNSAARGSYRLCRPTAMRFQKRCESLLRSRGFRPVPTWAYRI